MCHFRTEVLRASSHFAIVFFPFAVMMGDVSITALSQPGSGGRAIWS